VGKLHFDKNLFKFSHTLKKTFIMTTSCVEFETKFPLDFISDFQQSDEKLLFESIKSFKDPNYKSKDIQFLDGREIRVLAEFYSRYGETIR
jgi:hypothetical protein